jgi:hypothetical protein
MSDLKAEIIKSVKNPFFLFPLAFLIILSVLNACSNISDYYFFKNEVITDEVMDYNPGTSIMTVYNMWLGTRQNNRFADIFFVFALLFPVVVYSWSYRWTLIKDKKQSRYGIKKNFNKLIAIFISSGAVSTIPIIINFAVVSLFIPLRKPDSAYDIYFGVFSSNIMGECYYSCPLLYTLIYISVCFILCGAIGCMTHSLSVIIDNWILSGIIPIAFLLIFRFNCSAKSLFTSDISPISLMSSAPVAFENLKCLIIEFAIAIVIVCLSLWRIKTKKEAI